MNPQGELHSRISQLPPLDIIRALSGTQEKYGRPEHIPLNRIVIEGMAFDERHGRDLALAMLGSWGQTQTVLVRCREGGGLK